MREVIVEYGVYLHQMDATHMKNTYLDKWSAPEEPAGPKKDKKSEIS